MAISGYLSEFSLPEIFRLLEQGNKTGRLSIQERSQNPLYPGKIFRIWFKQGNIIAAGDRIDGNGLLSMIQKRGWVSTGVASRITEVCPIDQPAGLCLKEQGLLEAEQLKMLFSQQVLQQVCKLFELQDGQFQFEANVVAPNSELTGLKAPPSEVTLAGLRALKDWTMLLDKLPEASSGIVSAITGKPQLRLNQLESQVWEFTKGDVSLQNIAKHLKLPLDKIQQVAFRLMTMGLVEEVPFIAVEMPSQKQDLEMQMTVPSGSSNSFPSHAFLQNLLGHLKIKANA
ncbi:DUF4388 domain-containing protein [Pseudanabaena sp. UWO311]|uniref:DUF4388 domain-containing protein n=1 Tax=Pseudanabaena sp. UWO311 TaxID=2487337 RepID=UPI00115A5C58|nr:DUF4388 domain-containing protein [Pseudanabaena sp. UWO311]TYQ28395.1 DUF4388 domain-containing protein [Pseudanabaena sp. UWO311]